MKFKFNHKDGGPESRVWMYGLEIKNWFSILLLRFEDGSREAFHSHAFNAVSWLLSGALIEAFLHPARPGRSGGVDIGLLHVPRWRPIFTRRQTFHKVRSLGRTWVLSLRGPWAQTWEEAVPVSLDPADEGQERGLGAHEILTLGQGRRIIDTTPTAHAPDGSVRQGRGFEVLS